MATRNLTVHFIRARSAATRKRPAMPVDHSGNVGAFGSGSDHGAGAMVGGGAGAGAGGAAGWDTRDLHRFAPTYVDAVDEINRCVDVITQKMNALQKVHTDRLMVRFDGSESEKDREIDILTREITQKFNEAGNRLKRIATSRQDAESKIKKNIQRALASKLQSMSQEFRRSQKSYLGQLKQYKEGASFDVITGPSSEGVSESKDSDFGFNDSQMQHLMSAEELAQERDEEIRKIAKSIEELAQIFKELAALVIDQGTIIDRIDYNMEQVVERTKKGVEQLHKAEEYQKSTRPLKCIILLVVLIVVLLLVLILRKK